jgi:hypothetical protein
LKPTGWSLRAWLAGGAFVGVAFGVLAAATGDAKSVGYAIGFGIVAGGFLGALVGGLTFFLKYALNR